MRDWFTQTAEIWRAAAVSGTYGTPELLDTVRCSEITPTTHIDRLRAGKPDVVSLMLVYTDVPADTSSRPKPDDRFRLEGTDYRIRHVISWPVTRPEMLELFIEDEGRTYE